ncbi:MAG TPA: hypothetical protein VGD46_04890, partial [Rhizobacter sp.]
IKTRVHLEAAQRRELAAYAAINPGIALSELCDGWDVSENTVRTILEQYGVLVKSNKVSGLRPDSPFYKADPEQPDAVIDEAAMRADRDRAMLRIGQQAAELNALAAQYGYKVELLPVA